MGITNCFRKIIIIMDIQNSKACRKKRPLIQVLLVVFFLYSTTLYAQQEYKSNSLNGYPEFLEKKLSRDIEETLDSIQT